MKLCVPTPFVVGLDLEAWLMRGHRTPFANVLCIPLGRAGSGIRTSIENILRLDARVQSIPSIAATAPK